MGSMNVRLTREQGRLRRAEILRQLNMPEDTKLEVLEYDVDAPGYPQSTTGLTTGHYTPGPLIWLTHEDIKTHD